jgi:hypothetical protein
MSKYFSIILFILVSTWTANAQVVYQENILGFGNDLFNKKIEIQKNKPGVLRLLAVLDSNGNQVNAEKDVPLFEFVVNHEKVTSSDPIWQYRNHEIRELGNGGIELKLTIEAVRNPVRGLQLLLYQQFFPNTTLVREMIELKPSGNQKFELNKLDNKLYFKFPQYVINPEGAVQSKEIRIASWASEIIDVDKNTSFDERFPNGKFNDLNLTYNHMFHPHIAEKELTAGSEQTAKGPLNIIKGNQLQWITAYEHASQDGLRGVVDDEKVRDGRLVLDAGQGTGGIFNFPVANRDFQFLGIHQEKRTDYTIVAVEALRGAYLEGEIIDKNHPYSSVWTASAFSNDTSMNESRTIIHDYLWRCICEKPASRQPDFYYNTWGMQRRVGVNFPAIRDIMTEKNIIDEIHRAAEMGVDIFVLDDGWEQAQGIWTPHKDRLPNGLAPIKAELDKYGIKMGLWYSPMGIDSTTQRYKDHPEWVIKDSEGKPIAAQWGHPAFDFVSGFYDLFISDCKKMIDAGTRFMKWDAINTFYSRLPNLNHGSDKYSDEEIRARYEYLLPIYVTRAMKELTDYEPELVIEIDLTEARRVMTGLAPLSQGKLFWMNNGASGYNDYSVYRAKSMRSISNLYAGIIPLELLTYANYPQNANKALRYNVNTSLIAGHGFWGSLAETIEKDREMIRASVLKAKQALPFVKEIIPEVIGRIGSSPEIYTQVNSKEGAGQIIAFSGSALAFKHKVKVDQKKVLGVLNHTYKLKDDQLIFDFQFPMADATREAFVVPNQGNGISVISSTGWIDEMIQDKNGLNYTVGAPGQQVIFWAKKNGQPEWDERNDILIKLSEEGENYILEVKVKKVGEKVHFK